MSPLMKRAIAREAMYQKLSHDKTLDPIDVRVKRKALTNGRQWVKREMQPGNYHIPNGKQRMALKNAAR